MMSECPFGKSLTHNCRTLKFPPIQTSPLEKLLSKTLVEGDDIIKKITYPKWLPPI